MGKKDPLKVKVLATINDPGGAQALLPVLQHLNRKKNYQLDIIASGIAKDLLSERSLSFQEESSNIDINRAQALFAEKKPQLLLTGTSWQANLEQQLRNQAVKTGITSIVILDFWNNYRLRFAGASYNIEHTPDTICVPDVNAAKEMIADGFPVNAIQVTGHPFLEEIFAHEPKDINDNSSPKILFLSQPSVADGKTISRFDDLQMIANFLGRTITDKETVLEIKLHPKEEVSNHLLEMIAELDGDQCHVKLLPPHALLKDCLVGVDLVVGYYTIALFQARAMGKQVINIQGYDLNISLKQAMTEVGIINTALNESAIHNALTIQQPTTKSKGFHQGAVENIMTVLAINKKSSRNNI